VWRQLKALSADDFIRALEKDGWVRDGTASRSVAFIKNATRLTVHYHPQKEYGDKLLKVLLEKTGWSVDDLVRLKLVKLRGQRDSSSR
jgi:predicted RNA binding protein YcfA (HicA-like mRNA interferase family)